MLRGRCRACGIRISARYPLVEAGTAVLCALVVLAKGADEDALLGLALVLLLVPITLIDLDHRIIPNKLVLAGALAAPAILALVAPDDLTEHLIAAVAAGGFFLLAVLAYPRGMGMGDVKLAAVLGLFLGRAVGPAVFIALLSGTLVGTVVIARKGAREGRKTAVPFGPFLALGAVCALFAGDAMVDWYLSTFA
jgi:leader peptidase (prepilin peptidase)/N-methyltransferase